MYDSSSFRPAGYPPLLDNEQFGTAFRSGYPVTLRFLLSRGAHGDTAEEIAQAAWAKGWECLDQLQKPHMITAWVNGIAKNMLKNRLRGDQRTTGLEDATEPGDLHFSLEVQRILERCEFRDRTILQSYYIAGYTTNEIARQVGLTPVTVRVRLLRLRRSLRAQFSGWSDTAKDRLPN